MKSATLFFISSLIFSILISACAGRGSKSNPKSPGYVPLSEAEAKIYTTPTIYYIPQYDLTQQDCDVSARKPMKDKDNKVLFMVCAPVYNSCLLQGTCELKNEDGPALVNYAGQQNSEYKFSKVKSDVCHFGYGAGKLVCLDPYYSLAADLSIYRLGQVIYIPSVVGVTLPDGSKHDGYFVVRDSGGDIKGYGRFDFFTGFNAPLRAVNPFSKIDLSDKNTHFQYYVVVAEEALAVLKKRNYPLLPVSN